MCWLCPEHVMCPGVDTGVTGVTRVTHLTLVVPCDQAVNITTDAEDDTKQAQAHKHIDRSQNVSASGTILHSVGNVYCLAVTV